MLTLVDGTGGKAQAGGRVRPKKCTYAHAGYRLVAGVDCTWNGAQTGERRQEETKHVTGLMLGTGVD